MVCAHAAPQLGRVLEGRAYKQALRESCINEPGLTHDLTRPGHMEWEGVPSGHEFPDNRRRPTLNACPIKFKIVIFRRLYSACSVRSDAKDTQHSGAGMPPKVQGQMAMSFPMMGGKSLGCWRNSSFKSVSGLLMARESFKRAEWAA